MKEAILLVTQNREIRIDPNLRPCFQELVSVRGGSMTPIQATEDQPVYGDLNLIVGILNGNPPPPIQESTRSPKPSGKDPSEDPSAPPMGSAWVGLTDADRAEQLRRWIKERLTQNLHPLEGCSPYEVRLGKIYLHWGTGLSRASINRHLLRVVKELEEGGWTIFRGIGRYVRLSPPGGSPNPPGA